MRLYSYQSLEVLSIIHQEGIYMPSWDLINYKSTDSQNFSGFEEGYHWMLEEYNTRKGTTFTGPPVFWYTKLEQVKRVMNVVKPGECLITAEVPYDIPLLSEFSLWHHVLNGSAIILNDDWWWHSSDHLARVDEHYDLMFKHRAIAGVTQPWVKETWKHIFHLPRCQTEALEIHAVTGCIKKEWLQA
jgi:Domain of unknown function (DUF3841)